jgi:uncharacterized protein (TIGR00297 family)
MADKEMQHKLTTLHLSMLVDVCCFKFPLQVFANGAGGTLMAFGSVLFSSVWPNDALFRFCVFGFIGHYACCQGDTWASEFGSAFPASNVRLITKPWVRVPAGTNGGVTVIGTLAAIVGGMTLGLAYTLASWFVRGDVLLFASVFDTLRLFTLAALLGTTLDSVLGALLQLSVWDDDEKKIVSKNLTSPRSTHISGIDLLTNSGVNFFSALLTMLLVGIYGVLL